VLQWREKKRFLMMAGVSLLCLIGAGCFVKQAYSKTRTANRQNQSIESEIARKIAQRGGMEEDIQYVQEFHDRLLRQFDQARQDLSFNDLDQFVKPDNLKQDLYLQTWANLYNELVKEGRTYLVKLTKETTFHNPQFSAKEGLKALQIEDLMRKLPIVRHVALVAIRSSVSQVLQMDTEITFMSRDRQESTLVNPVTVEFQFAGTMKNFVAILTAIQQKGAYLQIDECRIFPPMNKHDNVSDDSLIMNLRVSALQIRKPVE